jgi:hypothetical protein
VLTTNNDQGPNKILAAIQILKEIKGQTIESATWGARPDGWNNLTINTTQGRQLLIEGVAFKTTSNLQGVTIKNPNCCRYEYDTEEPLWEIWIQGDSLQEPRPLTIMGEGYDTLTVTLL